jgi:3'-phosphoadenosine 5'-phosphosulfate sulfotransferase (PAPS reductase)/FAD synthetase
MRDRYGLNLTVTKPGPEAAAHPCGSEQCCQFRKVAPCAEPVPGKPGLADLAQAVDGPTRADAPIVSWDAAFGLVKVNPLATWTNDDIASYLADHGLPVHPLCHARATAPSVAPPRRVRWPRGRTPAPAAGRDSTSPSAGCTL